TCYWCRSSGSSPRGSEGRASREPGADPEARTVFALWPGCSRAGGRSRIMSGLHHLLVWFNDPANWHGGDGIPHRVTEHLVLWGKAMVIAVVIAVPGGLLLGRSRRSGTFTINVANIGRAIPSFAVLVVGVIWFGLSDIPVVIALVLLAIPPIFTFTFTAVRGVDRGVVESARGMGMSEPRVLRSVQVPLASPLMLNGIRLSSAAVLATVPLAALIGAGGLGRYVIGG